MARVTRSLSESERTAPPQPRVLSAKRAAGARKTSARQRAETSDIGELLRTWRKRNKLSQTTAANSLGVSSRTLQNWEQGHRTPRGFVTQQLRDKIR